MPFLGVSGIIFRKKCEKCIQQSLCYITLGFYHRCLTVGKKNHRDSCCHNGTTHSCCGQSNAQGFIKGKKVQLARHAGSLVSIGPKL